MESIDSATAGRFRVSVGSARVSAGQRHIASKRYFTPARPPGLVGAAPYIAAKLIAQILILDKIAANHRTKIQKNGAIVVLGQDYASERGNRLGSASGMQASGSVGMRRGVKPCGEWFFM
jgi:hypothetical protein